LRGQLAGRGTEAGVLDLQHCVRGAELIDFEARAPPGAQADQNRHHHDAAHGPDRRPQVDRQAAKNAGRTIRNQNGIAPRAHTLVIGSGLNARKGRSGERSPARERQNSIT
jgi:hypothetical protein